MDDDEKQDIDLENNDGDGEAGDDDADLTISKDDKKTDPFDAIDDIEELRAKAKEERAKRIRIGKKKGENTVADDGTVIKKAQKPVIDESKFVTKDDLYKGNERKAVKQLTVVSDGDDESTSAMKKDLKANWKEVMRFYRDVSGRDTVEDIVEDITDAYQAFRRRNPKGETDAGKEATAELSKKTGLGGKAPSGDTKTKKHILKLGKKTGAEQMLNWYPEPES